MGCLKSPCMCVSLGPCEVGVPKAHAEHHNLLCSICILYIRVQLKVRDSEIRLNRSGVASTGIPKEPKARP
jgi:hypothetical protein